MKTKILVSLLVFGLLSPSIFAWDESYSQPQYSAIHYYDFDLEIDNDGGNVYFEWNEFEKDEKIKWWKLVFSQKTSDISYPENDARYLGDAQDLDEAKQWFDAGSYYFRLCAVTHENSRYCGDVVKYSFDEEKYYEKEKEMKVCTMEYAPVCGKKDGVYKTYSNNCIRESAGAYKVENKYCEDNVSMQEKTESTFGLSLALRKRINEVLEGFIERLENRGDSDEEISDTIDIVLERLEKLQTQEKYKNIAGYMAQELRAMQEKYNDPLGDLESIFDDL